MTLQQEVIRVKEELIWVMFKANMSIAYSDMLQEIRILEDKYLKPSS